MLVKLVNEALSQDLPDVSWKEKPDTPGHYDLVFGREEEILSSEVARSVMGAFSRSPREDRSILPASSAGKCIRQRWHHLVEPEGEEPTNTRTRLNFAAGSAWESIHRTVLRNASKNHGDRLGIRFLEAPERVDVSIGGSQMGGYYDGILEVKPEILYRELGGGPEELQRLKDSAKDGWLRIMLEIKTQSEYSYRTFKSRKLNVFIDKETNQETFGYRTQMALYLRQAFSDGTISVPVGIWYVINKNTGHCAEQIISLKVLESEVEEADKAYATLSAALKTGLPPERRWPLKKDGNLGFQCSYCASKWSCYADEKVVGFSKIENAQSEETRWEPRYERPPREKLKLSVAKSKPVFTPVRNA